MKCAEIGCESEGVKRGLCQAHYSLFYRLGTLENHATKGGRGQYDREKKCSGIIECGKKHLAQGFCSPCYQAKRNNGDLSKKPPINVGKACSVENCGKEADRKGYCTAHYEKFLKYGDPLAYAPRRTGVSCSVDGCAGVAIARGWCSAHYARWQNHGDHLKTKIENWKKDRVDDCGYVMVYSPDHPNARKSNRVPKHRLVMSEFLGRALRKNENVHHINGVKADNRLENLELWVTSQPPGQRPQDLVTYAKKILKAYAGEVEKLRKLRYRNKPK